MNDKIPERGDDGKLRMDCPCSRKKLLFRYDPTTKGTIEIKCPTTKCRRILDIRMNPDDIPELQDA